MIYKGDPYTHGKALDKILSEILMSIHPFIY